MKMFFGERHVRIPLGAFYDSRLTPRDIVVYGALRIRANNSTHTLKGVSLDLLSDFSGYSKQTVGESLKVLEGLGYVSRHMTTGPLGERKCTEYELLGDSVVADCSGSKMSLVTEPQRSLIQNTVGFDAVEGEGWVVDVSGRMEDYRVHNPSTGEVVRPAPCGGFSVDYFSGYSDEALLALQGKVDSALASRGLPPSEAFRKGVG